MPDRYKLKEAVQFPDFKSQVKAKEMNENFNIEISELNSNEDYCQALINIAFKITHSQIPDFLNYNLNLHKDSLTWLNRFEKLLTVNEDLFHENKKDTKLTKFQTCIELKRNKIEEERKTAKSKRPPNSQINALSDERYFSFKETKLKTYTFPSVQEQIYFLTSEIYDYRTADIEMVNNKLPLFPEECEKLIGKIQTLTKMRAEMEPEKQELPASLLPYSKLRINCNVNQIVDVFFQLNREMFEDGKPFIDGSVQDIVAVIVNSFEDRAGLSLSPATVETILRPSKNDKRPNSHKRIDLDKLL